MPYRYAGQSVLDYLSVFHDECGLQFARCFYLRLTRCSTFKQGEQLKKMKIFYKTFWVNGCKMGMISSVLILKELVTWISAVGVVLTIAGLFLSEYTPNGRTEVRNRIVKQEE